MCDDPCLAPEERDDAEDQPQPDPLDQHGRDQYSLLLRHQLTGAGLTDKQISAQLRSGLLLRVGPGAYRPRGAAQTWQLRALAAVLSSRSEALVSHRSAAYLHGLLPLAPGTIDVTVPRHRRPRRREGVRFHESVAFDLADPVRVDRIPATGVAKTILDCCAVMPTACERLNLLDEARRLQLVGWDDLWSCLFKHAGRGRPGLVRLRDLLVDRDGEVPPDSVFVRRLALLLEEAGFPPPVFEVTVLAAWRRLVTDPAGVVAELRAALVARGHVF